MRAVFETDRGKVRSHNEDSVNVFRGHGQLLAVIADGMGGHVAGEVASGLALDFVRRRWQELDRQLSQPEAAQWLNRLVRSINVHLFDYAESHPECRGMGTTFAAALCDPAYIVASTVGDSRVYIWENGQALRQMSEDHTLVNELLKAGQITEAEAKVHPERHVLIRSLGTTPTITLDTFTSAWSDDHYLLLCSDGLTNKVSDEKMSGILEQEIPLEEKAKIMIKAANDAGGEDNISLIIISRDSDGETI
ncbi:MAG: Stp1/IreP family PP2C-type Ser/Thr phosphatase [Sporolactobacillus sp.]|jgi:protein phosphatase|nr:Stp1/IreP family PP2C-type Ser/Thr phosphatase [Sporolactobacillus sp.]MCI1881858.1 Stp1/IreP family PP2C-type Ser/Thr phosphatase [Sporolactobacillus sp.]